MTIEMKIDETRTYNGKRYVCLKDNYDCKNCVFSENNFEECNKKDVEKVMGKCVADDRSDNTNVHFEIYTFLNLYNDFER